MSARAAPPKATKPAAAAAKAEPAAAKAAPEPAAKPAAKAVKAAEPAKAEPVAAAEPVVENASDESHKVKKSRVQIADILNISISQARCHTHFKQNLGDGAVEEEIKQHRKDMKAAHESGDEAKEKELKELIESKSKDIVRISSGAPISAATALDRAVTDLLCHGMTEAIAENHKMVEVRNLHSGNKTSLILYPIYEKCASWRNYSAEDEERRKAERTAANKALKEIREAKKAETAKSPAAAAAPKKGKGAAPAQAPEADDADGNHSKTTFDTYVDNALKAVKEKDEAYKTMRVSTRVREYLSGLVAEIIARLAKLCKALVRGPMDVRTMTAGHVKSSIEILMIDEGRSAEQIKEIMDQIDEKLKIHHDHTQAEKVKKDENMDEEKKAELEKKKREQEVSRAKKAAEVANKRAAENAEKAKKLAEQVSLLESAAK